MVPEEVSLLAKKEMAGEEEEEEKKVSRKGAEVAKGRNEGKTNQLKMIHASFLIS